MIQKRVNERPKKNPLTQLGTLFPLFAVLLTAVSIFLPFWKIEMRAPQYPATVLKMFIYSYKMEGDTYEFDTLNHYAGVTFPSNLPEFNFLPYVLTGLAVIGLVIAFSSGKVRNYLLGTSLGLYLTLLVSCTVDLQYRLYLVGHNLDPHRPLVGIKPFTPPAVGPNQVGNMHTFSYFHLGALFLGLAVVLLFIAFRYRNLDLSLGEWFQRVRGFSFRRQTQYAKH